MTSSFRPSIAIVIGILSIMFSFTFLLLMYAKFCHAGASDVFANAGDNAGGLGGPGARFSGIDKAVIESLPLFRFSSLRGSKEGLECAVCLSRFEDTEVLRLLPKCKHAFHLECVDRWLENHSSCPLCRHKIDPGDLTTFAYSSSLRYPGRDPPGEPPLDLFVEREPDAGEDPDIAASSSSSSSRFSFMGSFRKQGKSKKEEGLIGQSERRRDLHRFKHRIVVSDVMQQGRWSDVNSSDLILLNSEMLSADSGRLLTAPVGYSASERYTAKPVAAGESVDVDIHSLKQEMDQKRSATDSKTGGIINRSFSAISLPSSSTSQQPMNHVTSASSEKRSMSETINLSRFGRLMRTKEAREASINGGGSEASSVKEERLRKIWLPIARRTVKWFAGRERREQSQSHGRPNARQELNV